MWHTGVCKKHSFYANPDPAIKQQRLLSSPVFLRLSLPCVFLS